jgi:hypothetical protein
MRTLTEVMAFRLASWQVKARLAATCSVAPAASINNARLAIRTLAPISIPSLPKGPISNSWSE